ncbi:small ubiquitin-related modifier 2-like [Panicum virgatum]|uniref:Ubiquitin-like domain-containing protein n=1 Tax=Panicum virgatum TaxID=38727 RepID=A0A8T0WMI9_PANVG|nr:small ubiquitin-related modifier 2-like [Panicum virgatum]KAG2646354.1 hypothetical protein PVAP13_2KG492600 [Panicum virgatum]
MSPPPPPQGVVKPEPDPLITLKVADQEGRRAFHTMRMSDRLDVTYGTGTFMFDGSIRLLGFKTAAELDLEDGDEIDFFAAMVGGGWDDGA